MWEGGRTLNRLTQAPPLRSARIQRLSSRSWQHQTPSTKLTPFPHTLQPIISQTYRPHPPYPQSYPTIATVSCKTCKHAIGWMCTKKRPTKTPVPESMWRQRYLNMFIDHFSQNLDKTNTENTNKRWLHGNVWNHGESKAIHYVRQFSISRSVGMVKTNLYIMLLNYKRNI